MPKLNPHVPYGQDVPRPQFLPPPIKAQVAAHENALHLKY